MGCQRETTGREKWVILVDINLVLTLRYLVMTDGCGLINRSALVAITKRIGYDSLVTAVQGRIGGGKGIFIHFLFA
jgi:hypothetical protein